jgi:hypothetical protein
MTAAAIGAAGPQLAQSVPAAKVSRQFYDKRNRVQPFGQDTQLRLLVTSAGCAVR